MFPRVTESELMTSIKNNITLKTYDKTFLTQLGMCVVIINYKNNKKEVWILCSSWERPSASGYAKYNST